MARANRTARAVACRVPRGQATLVALVALQVVALLITGLALGCRRTVADPQTSKLAILISIDTLRADHLGFNGYRRPTSPHLDALARDAVVFTAAQSTAPWTLPAHGTLLTGRYPSRLGLTSVASTLPPEIPTLAELLGDNGWRSAAIVNSRFLSQRYGFDRGFDRFEYLPETYHQIGSAAPLLERALDMVDEVDNEPLFLFLHIYDVHSDYRARHVHKYDFVRPYEGSAAGLTPQLLAVRKGEIRLAPGDLAHVVDLYDAQIREVDANLGRFFDGLRARGRFDDAFIAVVSDHGDEFLEHGGTLHGRSHYREIIRVPLIIRAPSWPRGKRVATPVSTVDLAATVLRALGAPLPTALEGHDLAPLAKSGRSTAPASDLGGERALFSEAALDASRQGELRAVRQGRYTLHLDVARGTHRLYDLESDPGEQLDLAASEPERAAQLLDTLERFAAGARVKSELREIGPAEREALEQLGYLSAPGAAAAAADRNVVHRH